MCKQPYSSGPEIWFSGHFSFENYIFRDYHTSSHFLQSYNSKSVSYCVDCEK